jgi:hypothetical protein
MLQQFTAGETVAGFLRLTRDSQLSGESDSDQGDARDTITIISRAGEASKSRIYYDLETGRFQRLKLERSFSATRDVFRGPDQGMEAPSTTSKPFITIQWPGKVHRNG